ncbi:FAD-binding domain-containing protein [Aaosphaeria arxii CBS 175.79]|uniref:FAD-binding domain-containing protein n=1 Tax=Aaosphaeria arxii CBS 175.79 TaxID=1450172 RepID=A0A6A5XR57_9PLEO|nr:FAD-binding domain-containing protein [Aaosphaeria arxii CBS 175.79]KAF2015241.1 FAD-binding domain-containing protein [Aaosphaeria arxii CBS 175.79]
MYSFIASWASLCSLLIFVSSVNAAVPDKQGILAQLRKNGACCTALDYFLPDKVHFNILTDAAYANSQHSFWAAQPQSLTPTCIVIPTSTQDVSTAIAILSIANQASIRGCQFAIRGAGHTPNKGANNIDGGVTIDMQSMDQVVVSDDRKTVSIGPGNRWRNIYPKLDELNLVMVGGRASQVGTGGLVTGGGISYFSGRYGFVCDNVKSFEVVLANSSIITASNTKNSDIFRALKGGSNNFGVVTRIDTALYPQEKFWGGTIAQPITNKELLWPFLSTLTASANFDPYAAIIINFAWLAGVPSIVNNVIYTDSDATWPPPSLQPLDSMPKISTTIRKDALTSFTDELAATLVITTGRLNIFSTLTFINDVEATPEFLAAVFDIVDATAKELLTVVGLIFTCSFQPIPRTIYAKSAGTGGNVLGLERFDKDFINFLFSLSWQLPIDNARVEAALKTAEAAIVDLAKRSGLYSEYVYLNYAAQWQEPVKSYGAQNVQFMRGVSKKYDPNGLFQKAVPGGFKLGI